MSSGRSFGKQEDINSVAIRDIQSSSPENKRCFDCGERGPTYVNVTIGSFVCTKCSGMLRGVNPPHRIKSISMSSFSEEDVNLLNSRGNLWCKKVWLGTYSGTSQDEQPYELRMKQLMIDKYEKKRYYVDPTTIKDLNSYSSIYIKQSKSVPTTTNTSSFNLIGSRISQKFNNHQGNNKLTNGASSTNTPLQKNGTNSRLSNQNGAHNARPASNNQPLLSNFNHPQSLNSGTAKPVIKDSDPFGALNSVKNESFSNTTKIESFANFETANFESPPTDPLRSVRNNNAALASSSSLSQQQPSTTAPLQPFSTNNNGCGSKVTTPSVSNVKSPVMNMSSCATQDRYAALKDLDDIFRSVNVSENGDLSGGNGSGGGSQVVFGNSSSMNGMSAVFGNSHNDNSAFGRNEKSFFDNADASSPVIKNTASSSSDAWKRLSSNSTDNQGWANFGNSNNSSTNPFSASSNFSQLNTSPWPTTGTSPVQSGTSFPKTSNNGALDPFSMNNSNFPSTSDVNDLFANAPKPSGGKGGDKAWKNIIQQFPDV